MKRYKNISWLPNGAYMDIIFKEELNIPVTAVFCFIFSEDKQKIYLMKNANRDRGLDIPGGHIDPGETSLEALHREILEEVGLTVMDVQYVGSQKITKDIVEEKYPDLISCQNFYMATIDKVITDELEKDSLERVSVDVEDFKEILLNKKDCYYTELYIKSLERI